MAKNDVHIVLYHAGQGIFYRPDCGMQLDHLGRALARQGYEDLYLYCPDAHEKVDSVGSVLTHDLIRFHWLDADSYDGNAGCLRHVLDGHIEGVVLVLPLGGGKVPNVDELVRIHRADAATLTAFSESVEEGNREGSDVYIMDATVLENIPEQGYWDIMENLVPELVVLGKNVQLREHPRNGKPSHVNPLTSDPIQARVENLCESTVLERQDVPNSAQVWCAPAVEIGSNVRFLDNVVLLEGAKVGDEAVVIGPAVINPGVTVGKRALVMPGVVEADVADSPPAVKDGFEEVTAECLPIGEHKPARMVLSWSIWLGLFVIAGAFVWFNGSILRDLFQIWTSSDEYSSGLLVPFLAVYVLWGRREKLMHCSIRPSMVWGGGGVLLGLVISFIGLRFMYASLERFSLIIILAGLVLWLAGKRVLRQTFAVLLFLFLMFPLPHRIQTRITLPLQNWATQSAVFSLEMLGYPVISEGHTIQIGSTRVAVAEACNGLRMITAFFVIGSLVALLCKRAWWEKALIIGSCLPISLLCNTIRLTVTSIAFTKIPTEYWEKIFHDFGGYAMMPLALAFVLLELLLLDRLFVSDVPISRDVVVRSVPVQN